MRRERDHSAAAQAAMEEEEEGEAEAGATEEEEEESPTPQPARSGPRPARRPTKGALTGRTPTRIPRPKLLDAARAPVARSSPSLASREEMEALGGEILQEDEEDHEEEARGDQEVARSPPRPRQGREQRAPPRESAPPRAQTSPRPLSRAVQLDSLDDGDERRPAVLERGVSCFLDVRFPPLRTVLWDRTPLEGSCVLGAEAHVPRLVFRRAALASLYNMLASRSSYFTDDAGHGGTGHGDAGDLLAAKDGPMLLGIAMQTSEDQGAALGEWAGGAWDARIDRLWKGEGAEPQQELDKRRRRRERAHELCIKIAGRRPSAESVEQAKREAAQGGQASAFVPGSAMSAPEELDLSEDEYRAALKDALGRLRARGPMDPMQFLTGYAACLALPGNRLRLRCEMLLPALTLEFTPVTPLCILSTPLARQLDVWASRAEGDVDPRDPTASGFLTLNQTRKAVFLLEDDPLAREIPLVGVWVRGSAIQGPAAQTAGQQQAPDWRSMLNDPLLWAACLRYIHNETIAEKVPPPGSPSAFLVALYPRGARLPSFVECHYRLAQHEHAAGSVAPRPFLQVECAFEVDVSQHATAQFPGGGGELPNAVSANLYHVERLERRRAFQRALDDVLGPSGGRDAAQPDLGASRFDSAYLSPIAEGPGSSSSVSGCDAFGKGDALAQDLEAHERGPFSCLVGEPSSRVQESVADENILFQSSETLGGFEDDRDDLGASRASSRSRSRASRSGNKSQSASRGPARRPERLSASRSRRSKTKLLNEGALVSIYGTGEQSSALEAPPSELARSTSTWQSLGTSRSRMGRSGATSRSRRDEERRHFMQVLLAQQEQMAVMQKQILGLHCLMEEQLRLRGPDREEQSKRDAGAGKVVSRQRKPAAAAEPLFESHSAVYVGALEQQERLEAEHDASASSSSSSSSLSAAVAAKTVEPEAGDRSVEAESPVPAAAAAAATSEGLEACETPPSSPVPTSEPASSRSGGEASLLAEQESATAFEPEPSEAEPSTSARLELLNEEDTAFGIPHIQAAAVSGSESRLGDVRTVQVTPAQEEEDPWLAELEAKYLGQIAT